MNIVAYGGGTNSTAMLVNLAIYGNEDDLPSLILFSDTGGERPETYEYVEMFSGWLVDHGLPEIITVRASITLEEDCLNRKALPSIAYGFKTCSQRFKSQAQDKYINNWGPAKKEWSEGRKITKFIGFDADEPQRAKEFEDKKYTVRYPLIEWDWGREECLQAICKEGLPQPGKSSCFFCPSMRPAEIRLLKSKHPDLAKRAIFMEENARENLTTVKGLGRNWAWSDLLATDDMFEDEFHNSMEIACGCYDG